MIRSKDHRFDWRLQLVMHAQQHGQRATARAFRCSRNTVAKWLARFQHQPGRHSLLERSRAPHTSPHKAPPAVEQQVLAQRRRTPGFGAERLKREFELPCGISAINRILRQHGLTRPPRRRHQRKNDLRAIKAAYQPFTRFQMDVKFLTDIPHYWPQMQQRGLPKFQYTIRELSCGAQFLAYADEVSVTYSELAARRLLVHLQQHGIDPATVVIQSDNGTEFDGTARHKRDRGFVHTIETLFGAAHRYIPPGCSNANADVESIHSTIEPELYDIERFADLNEFLTKAATCQLWYNTARKNRSRGWKSPLDLLEEKAPMLDVRLLLLHPVLLNRLRLTAPTRDAPVAHHLPIYPGML
jgi:transposase